MPDPTPTEEQQVILDAYTGGRNLVINAYAGTGKTTTLKLLANANRQLRVVYLAYNKAAQIDAKNSFPVNARCMTSHGLAYQPMIDMAKRIGGPRVTGTQLAKILGLLGPQRLTEDKVLSPAQLASIVRLTIQKFCYSADERITGWHVPRDLPKLSDPAHIEALKILVPPIAQRAWDNDITKGDIETGRGRFPMNFDYYLKAYCLTHPRIPGDVVMLDEAQDSNPAVAALFREQAQYGTQLVAVGDQNQAIYGWRGAVDAMQDFTVDPDFVTFALTQSFRFGPEIAAEGNKWLRVLGCTTPLRGWDQRQSRVGDSQAPDAILCRTNAEAVRLAIIALNEGKRVAFPGGVGDLKAMTFSARDLQNGRPAEHPELMPFSTWGEVQDYVELDDDGADLKRFVELVDEHGTDGLLAILDRIKDDGKAGGGDIDVTISTAHKAKGRQWRIVLIADDFMPKKKGEDAPPNDPAALKRAESMLAYVAVTRAEYVLTRGGLGWIDGIIAMLDSLAGLVTAAAPAEQPEPEPEHEPTADAPQPALIITIPLVPHGDHEHVAQTIAQLLQRHGYDDCTVAVGTTAEDATLALLGMTA